MWKKNRITAEYVTRIEKRAIEKIRGEFHSPQLCFRVWKTGLLWKTEKIDSVEGLLVPQSIGPPGVAHALAAAAGTDAQVNSPDRKDDFLWFHSNVKGAEQLPALDPEDDPKIPFFPAVVQKPVITDFLEPGWKDMHQESP